ncbi:ATP-binding cassette domain-containing protein [Streptomyces sp. CG 926]|uniref:ATP-binding cassette domain-containing protein n=1 Tax=Streptomyces sp. CG 926 TaxID=1882405 RepID=UPI0035C2575D
MVPDGTPLLVRTPSGEARIGIGRTGATRPTPDSAVPSARTARSPSADQGTGSGRTDGVADGAATRRLHRIGPTTVIGRADGRGSDDAPGRIAVPGLGVAARHATLTRRAPGEYHVADHGRGSGTFTGGRAVLWARITPGATFSVGRSRFTLVQDGVLEEVRYGTSAGLAVEGLRAVHGNDTALDDLTFTLEAGQVLAVLGPSGAGKTTLFRALLGEVTVTGGRAVLQGLDSRTDAAQVRLLLGLVPQDDDLHRTITVRQVLDYAARLRMASDVTAADRGARVEAVCGGLNIADRMDTQVNDLSGGERKRVSIALEILGDPSLLMLDEPTSGLDPGAAREVMRLLRSAADRGCTVILVTHSTDQLHGVDQLLLLAPGGRSLYFGPPGDVLGSMDAPDYPTLMDRSRAAGPDPSARPGRFARFIRFVRSGRSGSAGPGGAARPGAAGRRHRSEETARRTAATRHRPRSHRPARQTVILTRRELSLLAARGPAGLLGLVGLAMVCGAFAALVASDRGLGGGPGGNPEALQVVNLLIIGAVLCGQALSYGNVVADFPIVRREFRTGVSPGPVVAAKALVYAGVGTIQAVASASVYLVFRPGPAAAFGLPSVMLLVLPLIGTVVCSMALGLLVSVCADRLERAVTLVTFASVCQVALNGVPFKLTSGPLHLASLVVPARWGQAALGSLTDVGRLVPGAPHDPLWAHRIGRAALDNAMLALLTALFLTAAWLVLRHRLRPI